MKVLLRIMDFETIKDMSEGVIKSGTFNWDVMLNAPYKASDGFTTYRPKHIRFTFELDEESPRNDDMLVFDCTNVEIT